MSERVVIVGAGQAGVQVAVSLRQLKFEGEILLLGDEPHPPYQRPPLSKKYLMGEMAADRTWLRSQAYYERTRIDLRLATRVRALDRARGAVELEGGAREPYDVLVLATGSRARVLPIPGAGLPGVLYLRTLADADRIRARAAPGLRAVVVGGGYIGLEVAASLTAFGCRVVVLEAQARVLNRVVGEPVSAFFDGEHRRHGVEIRTGVGVEALEGNERVREVLLADGERVAADLVVIGVGAVPDDDLARAAGLEIGNGLVVDEVGRTSDRRVFAAGDLTDHPSPLFGRRLRLESVHNAIAQAKTVAQAILGEARPYAEVPWFWSDQYDLKLQIAGIFGPEVEIVLRGEPASRSFSCLHLANDRLLAIDAINRGADFLAAQRLIGDGTRLDLARAREPEVPLREAIA
jgi:3-phenylpropionate/trans-cinnamate dioxygenase ferredoxin reductase component